MGPERRRYRKVLTRMWADERFRELSKPKPNGQSLWQFLITGPHTTAVPGLFTLGEAALAESLEWPLAGLRRAWDEIESKTMAHADWSARVVWLPNALRHNVPESPNVVRSWRDSLDQIPACQLKAEAITEIEAFLKGCGEAYVKAFAEVTGHPSPNQEQDQEQDQEVQASPVAEPRKSSRGRKQANPPNPQVREFLEWFQVEFKARRQNADCLIVWGRDGALVKEMLAATSYERLQKYAQIMLSEKCDDEFIENSGRDIPILKAKFNWLSTRLAAWEAKRGAA